MKSVVTLILGFAVADPGEGQGGHDPPPGPVKISHKKDGRQRRPHRFHVSYPPPLHTAAGSATGFEIMFSSVYSAYFPGSRVITYLPGYYFPWAIIFMN